MLAVDRVSARRYASPPTVTTVYTAVIATRAGEPGLAAAIESIAAQSAAAAAILVVTDADDDRPPRWTEHLGGAGCEIRFLVQPGRGLASALTWGIGQVRTPYVAFLDADDVWNAQKQEQQVRMLDDRPEIDAVTCVAVNARIDDDGSRVEARRAPAAMFTATTFRTDAFTRFGFPDPSAGHYAWLYRWWARARAAGIQVAHSDYVGLERRIHGGNSWVTGSEEAHRALFAEVRRISKAKGGTGA